MTAAELVMLSGKVIDPANLSPLPGVRVELQDALMSPIFSPATTDAIGSFSFSLFTNMVPVNRLDLFATASGRISTYFYPAREVTADLELELALLSPPQVALLAAGAGVQLTAGTGTILLIIADCNDTPIPDATIVLSSPGDVRYFEGVQPSMTATATDAGGVVMIANVPPGNVTVTASTPEHTLPARDFVVVADTFIVTEIVP